MGNYVPGSSPVHKTPLWIKATLLLAVGVLTLLLQGPIARSVLLVATLAVHLVAGLPVKRLWSSIRIMWFFLVIIISYQTWVNGLDVAWSLVAGILVCVYAANILTSTTEIQVLLDGVVKAASPFQRFGANPEKFALTISIMLRSIPFIVGAFENVRNAAMARGLERNPRARVLPVVITTVAYARQTGNALAARGIGDG
ncbi:energy-coupling factor transporter transmembrane component T family protein [Arthrobacter roseus]|uniref:energy-coupling factor transporter transmembrane component T family protein n=1 Tax=Arthrobacter roseus TaxID=136274 RepID=UPI001EF8C694|nr:energy-coupling factor transporter transmembrane component T [Arthrobacter roseus]MBM7848510.1 biotin transport system permease protein [Arthrobacter roseus]